DHAVLHNPIIQQQAVLPELMPAAGDTADERHAWQERLKRLQELLARREGVAEHQAGARRLQARSPQAHAAAQQVLTFGREEQVFPLLITDMEGRERDARQLPGQHADPWLPLDLLVPADDALARAADESARRQLTA